MIVNRDKMEVVNIKNYWNKTDIATYFSIGLNIVNKVIKVPTFPKQARMIKKWSAIKVKKWFEEVEKEKELKDINKNKVINEYL